MAFKPFLILYVTEVKTHSKSLFYFRLSWVRLDVSVFSMCLGVFPAAPLASSHSPNMQVR